MFLKVKRHSTNSSNYTCLIKNYENQDKSLNVPALKQSLETTILQLRDYNNGDNHESK